MKTLDKVWVCVDCLFWLTYADASGLDSTFDEDEAARRLAEMQDGEKALRVSYGEGVQLVNGDSDEDEEFSTAPCACCGSRLGGSRHPFVVLQS